MPVDCRHIRELALAATLSRLRAKSERLSEYKKSKARLGSVVAHAVAGSCYQRRCSSMGARRTTASTRI
jgi:hypothetical protein